MTKPGYPLDRSAAFTALLELSPEFGKTDLNTAGELITEFLQSWRASDPRDMFAHAREWLGANPIASWSGSPAVHDGQAIPRPDASASPEPAAQQEPPAAQAEPDAGR